MIKPKTGVDKRMKPIRKSQSKLYCVIMSVFFALIAIFAPIVIPAASAGAIENTGLSKPSIRSGSEINYPPFCIVDKDGMASGFSAELLRAALGKMGYDVTFRTGKWTQVRDWLEKGEIDALPLVGRTPEREFLYDFTFSYMSIHGAIVVRSGAGDIRNLNDLKGRRVAVMKGDNAEEFLRRENRGFEIHATATFDEALRDLSEGHCDAVVIQRLVALRLIQEKGIKNVRVVNRPIEGFRQDFCFAVREGDRETLALLNEGLALVMADGTYNHLHAKWFAALELPTHRRIIIGGDHNYPPFEFLDDNGRPAGYNVELTRAIGSEMGLDIEIRLAPWSEIRDALARGEIDALQGLSYSPERDLALDFTPPYTVNHYVSVVRKGAGPSPETVAELAGKRIAVQKSNIMHEFAKENGLGNQLTVVDSQEDALGELSAGMHDCALVARVPALYWINKNGWDNLVVGRHPFLSSEYCYAVPQNHRALLSQLGEGLKMIDKTGEYRRISRKWMGVYDDSAPGVYAIARYVAMVAVPLLGLLLAFFLWSWSLRKQVALRTSALRKSEAQYRLLADNVSDVIWTLDLKQRFTYVSPSVQKLLGYTPEEALRIPLKNTMTSESYKKGIVFMTKAISRDGKPGGSPDVTLTLELEHIRKDGGTLWTEITTSFIRNGWGSPSGFIGITRDISERKQAEEQRDKLISDLQKALVEVKILSGLLPICSHCKNIRDDKGYWTQIELYFHEHSDTEFSHGICPECAKKFYPEMNLYEGTE